MTQKWPFGSIWQYWNHLIMENRWNNQLTWKNDRQWLILHGFSMIFLKILPVMALCRLVSPKSQWLRLIDVSPAVCRHVQDPTLLDLPDRLVEIFPEMWLYHVVPCCTNTASTDMSWVVESGRTWRTIRNVSWSNSLNIKTLTQNVEMEEKDTKKSWNNVHLVVTYICI